MQRRSPIAVADAGISEHVRQPENCSDSEGLAAEIYTAVPKKTIFGAPAPPLFQAVHGQAATQRVEESTTMTTATAQQQQQQQQTTKNNGSTAVIGDFP